MVKTIYTYAADGREVLPAEAVAPRQIQELRAQARREGWVLSTRPLPREVAREAAARVIKPVRGW